MSTKNFSVPKLKALAPFMGHLGYSGYTFNASYCHFVIFMIIYSQAVKLGNLTFYRDILIILIDCFDFTICIHCHFFFNLDKFYVKRSEPDSLGLSAL